MASIKAQIEQAIARMMLGEPAPAVPFVDIVDPGTGAVPDWDATFYEIPDDFPNPPPARPLRGINGARFLLAQCGCNTEMIEALVNQGFRTPEKFKLFRDPSQIDSLVNNLFRIPIADGGCRIPASVVILLKATVKWVVEQLNYEGGRVIDAYLLTIPTLDAWEESINKHRDGSSGLMVEKPPILTDEKKWVAWKEAFINYLSNVVGVNGETPLAYVIRDHIVFTDMDVTPLSTSRIRGTTHDSTNFREDNVAVYSLLHQLLLTTDSYVHVAEYEGTKDGQAAFAALCYHYDGPSAVSNRLAWAKSEIAASTYRNENQFSLEKYGNRLANAFRILRQHGQGKSSGEEVDTYLQGINSNNVGVMQAVQLLHLQNEYATDFVKTRAKLQEMVAKVFQSNAYKAQHSNSPSGRKVAQVKTTPAKGGGGKGKGSGSSGGGDKSHEIVRKDGKEFYKDVDITDVNRTFSPKEFRKIKPIFSSYIVPRREPKQSNVSAVEQQKKSSNGNKFGSNQYD